MVTGIDPGVESGESVARTVTARAVMPNQGPPAARRAVRGAGADELNRHDKRGVDRGGRIQPADALSHQYAYLNLRGAEPLFADTLSVQCAPRRPASTARRRSSGGGGELASRYHEPR